MQYTKLLILSVLFFSCSRPRFATRWTKEEAPPVFVAHFATAKGAFDIEIHREYSPKAVDRVFQLIKHHYYDNGLFYRMVPNFVVQFGNSDQAIDSMYETVTVPDEKVIYLNKKGTISFARSGKDSRATQLFINLKDNPKLDTIHYGGVTGFPAFGNVISGMNIVESLYGGYSDSTMKKYNLMYENRSAFLKLFPEIDGIRKVSIRKL